MTGTVIISKNKSFDVRNIDFEFITDVLRSIANNSDLSKKLLQSKDEFGMDMLCADDLDAKEFFEFYGLLLEIRKKIRNDSGLAFFVDKICEAAQEDERLQSNNF